MHIVTLTKPIETPRWKLGSGDWLCEDLSAFELAIDADRGTAFVQPYCPKDGWTVNLDGSRQRLLWIHNGGYGDLMMAGPAIRKHAALNPDIEIVVSCRHRIHCVFDELPYRPAMVDYPVTANFASFCNRVITSEHIQESSEDGKTIPAVDLKARLLGVGPLVGDERKVEYVMKPEEVLAVSNAFPRLRNRDGIRKRIGIQPASSSPTRNYSHQNMTGVLTQLYADGFEIIMFGSPGSIAERAIPEIKRDLVKNATLQGFGFRESAALASTCDCIICMDSSFAHLAGALNIPCVALFASTDWHQRTADYPSVFAIQGAGPCSPCWHHPKGAQIWPEGKPCASAGLCVPLNMIPPSHVVSKVKQLLAK